MKLPTGNTRSASIAKKVASGTSPVPATVPAQLTPGNYTVQVSGLDGTSNTNILFRVTQPPPVLATINPSQGINNFITVVTLT